MSKGLEVFNKFCDSVNACINSGGITNIDLKAKQQVEKDLELLGILKSKPWLLSEIAEAKDYQTYQSWCSVFRADVNYRATETEFKLIKEWLER